MGEGPRAQLFLYSQWHRLNVRQIPMKSEKAKGQTTQKASWDSSTSKTHPTNPPSLVAKGAQ